jgi:CubicO group peptidase (beta-lactamase class C family)
VTLPSSTRPFDARVLAAVDGWEAGAVAVAVVDTDGLVATHGPPDVALPWASVTKLLTAYTVLCGVRRGIVELDDPAGPDGSTLRHLLAHASGMAFDSAVAIAPPGRTRIYSNAGFDAAAAHLAQAAGRSFDALLRSWVLDPLGMSATRLTGAPSAGLEGPVLDLAAFAHELLQPRLLPVADVAAAARVVFPDLRGVLPGVGLMNPNDWGLGFELRDGKTPHWTGARNSPRTFGHFGRSGAFLWVDPEASIALACVSGRAFGEWALEAWPAFSDAVLAAAETGATPTSPRSPARP